MAQERLDQLLVEQGLAESREKARRLIMAGQVLVNGQQAAKPGHRIAADSRIAVKKQERFVSRGGLKLERAFEAFELDVRDMICLDIGASTGGFSDCLLQHGAALVYAVDVGRGQLHWKLCQDKRVVIMDKTNARYLKPDDFEHQPQCAVMDVSFISITRILPALRAILPDRAPLVTLIKPQFEAGRDKVGKGGVVRDPAVHEEVLEAVRTAGRELGLEWLDCRASPIKGPAGNIEFLTWWKKA